MNDCTKIKQLRCLVQKTVDKKFEQTVKTEVEKAVEKQLEQVLQQEVEKAVEKAVENATQPEYAQIWFTDNTDATVITVVGQFEPINTAVAQNQETNDFVASGTSITYVGSSQRTVQVILSVSWEIGFGFRSLCDFGVTLNGTILDRSVQQGKLNDNRFYPRNATSSMLVQLQSGDVLQAVVANKETTDNVLIMNMNFHALVS